MENLKTCSKCSFNGCIELFRKNRNVCLKCTRKTKADYQRRARVLRGDNHRENERKSYEKNKRKNAYFTKIRIDSLSDSYVKRVACNYFGISSCDVAPELLEAKRNQILLHRLIRSSYE